MGDGGRERRGRGWSRRGRGVPARLLPGKWPMRGFREVSKIRFPFIFQFFFFFLSSKVILFYAFHQ